MNNILAFSTFKDKIISKKQLSNGDITFLSNVIYFWAKQSKQETLNVTLRLTTNEFGRISIDEGIVLNSDNFHLELNPNFQEYKYNKNGYLIIKGQSSKLGNYSAPLK